MSINLIHVSDIHLGSGESHGCLNHETGLNVRLEDFEQALSRVVDYCLAERADLFLFSGDAYRNASPEPIYQKLFAQQLKRLSDADIPSVLLVGNHDQLLKATSSHSMSVFQTLAVPKLVTIDHPELIKVRTASGVVQLVGLPYVTKHQLMTNEDYTNMSPRDIDRLVVSHVRALMRGLYDELDPSLPAVATAHVMVDSARAGAEQELMVGYSMSFPLDIFVDHRLDYVALGHVHTHQVLRAKAPAVVYAGSLERVDFSEQDEDKGFVHVQLERGSSSFEFHSINPRPFVTVETDLRGVEDPTAALVIAVKKAVKPGCVLRVRYQIAKEILNQLDENAVRLAAQEALSLKLQPEVITFQRDFRMPQLTETAKTSPLAALDTYLSNTCPERKATLLEKARDLAARLEKDDCQA